ncbi:TorF family putative porin [Shewanella sp. NIFS-20-20]|uniref:TorF family putative porin n=1 Tax=Shewanella sp. NIFS-20-20 TaxID=2853806 RepID=UPI001C44D1B2|nr:TorF family putative porin [Shewanella sp. NIFS-20-20]MBV7317543.1 TorF family putative porin [Shewanella sp. NIFS-20-20]
MNTRVTTIGILVAASMVSGMATAAVSGNIGVTSNYLWRGVTQTNDAVAVQGGLDYEHESGLYLTSWASNVDFGDETSYELDLGVGYSNSIGEFAYDIGYVYYAYPDAVDKIDIGEIYGSIGWNWLTIGYSHFVNASDGIVSEGVDSKDYGYLTADIGIPVNETYSINIHYGYSSGDVIEDWFEKKNYSDYNIALNAETSIGTVSFMISDTDLNSDDPKVILGYSFGFDL